MRKVFLRYTMLLAALVLGACGGDDKVVKTEFPAESLDDDFFDYDLQLDNLGPCVENPNLKQSLVMNDGTYYQCIDGLWLRVELSSSSKKGKSSSSVLRSSSSSETVKESSSSERVSSETLVSSSDNSVASSSVSSSSVSESSDSSSSASSSSSNGSAGIDLTVIYDCAEYDCVTTDYLNSKMLGSGMYGWYLDTRDSQVYRTVKIGSQTWMAQNLNYATEKSACYYDYDYYCSRFGRLYYQSEALTVCPEGWHLPSSKEWDELEDYVANELGDSTEVGNSLKSIKSWTNEMGSDLFGFSGLASRYFGEVYICGGAHGVYWTSKDCEYRCLLNDRSDLYSYWEAYSVDWGMSVRCVLDADVAGEDSGS